MANTTYQQIFDLFMMQVEDYRLIELYNGGIGQGNLDTYLQGFMVLAIPDFQICNQDLSDRDDTTKTFGFVMSDINQKVLSKLMVKEWLSKELKDILQMRAKITDHDFKQYSEAQNTTSKQKVLSELREECSQMLVDYALVNNDWAAWLSGNFMGN